MPFQMLQMVGHEVHSVCHGQHILGVAEVLEVLGKRIEGELEIEMQGHRLRPTLGEEVFIPAGVPQRVRNRGTTRSRWYFGYRQR